jgi:hypothetical protein
MGSDRRRTVGLPTGIVDGGLTGTPIVNQFHHNAPAMDKGLIWHDSVYWELYHAADY